MRIILALVLACGCGSAPQFGDDAGDATVDAPSFSFSDAPPVVDAPYTGPIVTLDAGGPFLCHGCICDGTRNYCYDLWVGAPLDAAPGPCPTDAGQSNCLPYPPDCLSNPSCECLLGHSCPSSFCALDPSGQGLDVLCALP